MKVLKILKQLKMEGRYVTLNIISFTFTFN